MDADHLINSTADKIDQQAHAAFERLLQLLADGVAARDAISQVMFTFGGEFAEALRGAFSDLIGRSVGRTEVLSLPIGDIVLSERLYEHTAQLTNEVVQLVSLHANGMQQARALALRLYDGYSPQDGIVRPLEGRARAELPYALRTITQPTVDRRIVAKIIEQGQRSAAKLKTPALRAAYAEAFDAWRAGKGADILNRRLDTAVREKTRFMASRIAVTELARANAAQAGRELMTDPAVNVVQVRINPMHPRADICDLHARADLWGLGAGCYPKAKAPQPTYHPFCRCRLRSRPDLTASGAREEPFGPSKYLRGFDRATAARIMGSAGKAERVLSGQSVESVVNEGVDPAYRLVRLGDPAALEYPLLGSVGVPQPG